MQYQYNLVTEDYREDFLWYNDEDTNNRLVIEQILLVEYPCKENPNQCMDAQCKKDATHILVDYNNEIMCSRNIIFCKQHAFEDEKRPVHIVMIIRSK